MIESLANPPTWQIQSFEKSPQGFAEQPFSVQVRSQDTEDQGLRARFWLSGRSANTAAGPVIAGAGGTLPPSSLDDTSRVLSKGWKPLEGQPPGCYELFWLVSHDFADGDTDCPLDPADSARISWTILICDSAQCPEPNPLLATCADRNETGDEDKKLAVPCEGGS